MTDPLGRDWIAAHVPHKGAMSLLDEVVRWDFAGLTARATRHGDAHHPLRRAGILPSTSAIEYGAQAVAAHGALLSHGTPARGFLASVRGVSFSVARLDDVAGALDIEVRRLGGAAHGLLYSFSVGASGRELVSGRLTIALNGSR